jgi:hypothetical protein
MIRAMPPRPLVGELPLAVAGAPDTKLVHPMSKSVWVETEDSSRTLWPFNNSPGLFKGGKDMVSL